jgi:orotate phosphoribosyltransferase-like protein
MSSRLREFWTVTAVAEHIATAKRMKSDGHTAKDIAKYLRVSRATM